MNKDTEFGLRIHRSITEITIRKNRQHKFSTKNTTLYIMEGQAEFFVENLRCGILPGRRAYGTL